MNSHDRPLIEEENITAEMRRVVWGTFFTKKKVKLVFGFLFILVGIPLLYWDVSLHRHLISGKLYLSLVAVMEFLGTAIIVWFFLLAFVMDEFSRFHGITRSIFPFKRIYECAKSPLVPKSLKWTFYSIGVLALLWFIVYNGLQAILSIN